MNSTSERTVTPADVPSADEFLDLVRAFPPRPIDSETQYDRAIAILNAISDKPPSERTAAEDDYYHVLGLVVEDYEDRAYPDPLGGLVARPEAPDEAEGIGDVAVAAREGLPEVSAEEADDRIVEFRANLGAAVRRARKAAGLVQASLGARIGVLQAKVSRIEAGAPDVSTDLLLAAYFRTGGRAPEVEPGGR